MLHPIWINIGLIINMFKHFLMYISWREDLCLFYDDKIFRAQGIWLRCHHSVPWTLFTLPEGASLCLFSAKPRLKKASAACTEGLFMWMWSYLKYVAGLGGKGCPWVCCGGTVSAGRAKSDLGGGRRGSDLEGLAAGSASKAIQSRSSDSWKTCTKVSKERERLNAVLGRL